MIVLTRVSNFTLQQLDNDKVWSLHDATNRAVMLTFWTSWCPDSLRDLQAKQRLYESMNHKAVDMVMIHVTGRDPEVDVAAFLNKHHYTFPVLLDEGTMVYDQFQCTSVPTTILLNRDHEHIYTYGDQASIIEIMQGLAAILP